MGVNLLEALGVTAREDVITNLLAHCYNHSAVFRNSFLRALGVAFDTPSGKAYTRVLAGDSGVPDIVIVNPDGSRRTLVVIEHKLDAEEGGEQTERYSSRECLDRLVARFSLDEGAIAHYIFLTLFPDERPESPAFTPVAHEALLKQEWPFPTDDTSWAPEFTRAWLDVLDRFYNAGRMELGDDVLTRLRQKDPLEGSFLAFRHFMQSVPRPAGLEYFGSWRSSQKGRRYYLAKFGKSDWQPREMDQLGRKWLLDPETCFSIHVEPQFNVLSGSFSIFLHYETNPYLTEKEARSSSLEPKDYEAYERRRRDFISAFGRVRPDDVDLGGGWNQFAKAALSLEGLSVDEASRRFGDLLWRIAESIDRALGQLQGAREPA